MPKTTRAKSYSKRDKGEMVAKARKKHPYLSEYLSEYILGRDGTFSVKAAPCCGGQRGFTREMSGCGSMCDARDLGGCECMHHNHAKHMAKKVSIDDPRLKPLNWSEEAESGMSDAATAPPPPP